MKSPFSCFAAALICSAISSLAEVKVISERIENDQAGPGFKFRTVPVPLRGDAAGKATFTLVDGERDGLGGDVAKLHDGVLPNDGDQPGANFYFRQGTDGGRVAIDLGADIDIKQVNSYSWHRDTRGPQVYRLYASDGKAAGFNAQPKKGIDPATAGWKLIANVDTRPKEGVPGGQGGQYGVSIADSAGSLGKFHHLLFDISRTEGADPFGNTFFSEIDVIDLNAPEVTEVPLTESVDIEGGYRFTVDTTETPDLTEWAHNELIPVMKKWYPMIVTMLPSDGYEAPKRFSIVFTEAYKGVAATMGSRIEGNPGWYRKNLKGEGKGSMVHELVHVVQRYGRSRKPGAKPSPTWLSEGLADYIRWYLYEPESHGTDIKPRNAETARYDASYRVTANFLNFVVGKYDKDLIKELNTAMRESRYDVEIWKTRTGHAVEELAEEWKASLANPALQPK